MPHYYQSIPAPLPRQRSASAKSKQQRNAEPPAPPPYTASELRMSSTGIAVPLTWEGPTYSEEDSPLPAATSATRLTVAWHSSAFGGKAQPRDPDQPDQPMEVSRRVLNDASRCGTPGLFSDDDDEGISEASDEECLTVGDLNEGDAEYQEGEEGEEGEYDGRAGRADSDGGRLNSRDAAHALYLRIMAEKQRDLDKLTGSTPLARLRGRERQAERCFQAQDLWTALRLRQEALGFAKLLMVTYHQADMYPLLLSTCHLRLAHAYSDVHYMHQTAEHCQLAMQWLPDELEHRAAEARRNMLLREVHILGAESLLRNEPPKAQAALQHLMQAAGGDDADLEQEPDAGLLTLISQCRAVLALNKLGRAQEAKDAGVAAAQQAVWAEERLANTNQQSMARKRMEANLEEARQAAKDEQEACVRLCDEARADLDIAADLLIAVREKVESPIRAGLAAKFADTHDELWVKEKATNPLISTLLRRSVELTTLDARLLTLRGGTVLPDGMPALDVAAIRYREIVSNQASYGCLPLATVAQAHRDCGQVHELRGRALTSKALRKAQAEAETCYQSVLELNSESCGCGCLPREWRAREELGAILGAVEGGGGGGARAREVLAKEAVWQRGQLSEERGCDSPGEGTCLRAVALEALQGVIGEMGEAALRGGALENEALRAALAAVAGSYRKMLGVIIRGVPWGAVAQARKDLGALYIRQRKYDEAVKQYEALLEVQDGQHEPGDPLAGVVEAEACKLMGDAFLAMKDFARATAAFKQAQYLYQSSLGEECDEVADLALRLEQVLAYTAPKGPSVAAAGLKGGAVVAAVATGRGEGAAQQLVQ